MRTKVLHLSSFDLSGGAARAAYRIHQGLKKIGVDSQMLVKFKSSSDATVEVVEEKVFARLRSILDEAPLKVQPSKKLFSLQWFPDVITRKIEKINPEIINLNWICGGFLNIETLKRLQKPLVWTLQDMWPMTGGCHYSEGCDRYQNSCGQCPQLNSTGERDLSRWVWQRKSNAWSHLNLTVVTPSAWMAQSARSSSLFKHFRIEVIPFGLDTTVFKPINFQVARDILGLPQDKKLILFGALNATSDERKGLSLLQSALKRLSQSEWQNQIELVVFGSSAPVNPVDFGFPTHYLGHLNDDLSLRVAYTAADVMIAPSIEEAFGQTASESLACGTPVVVFHNTGLQDIVDHLENGYIAQYKSVQDLAQGIAWTLEDPDRHHQLRTHARDKAEREFSLERQAHAYLSLFEQILEKSPISFI